MEYEQLKELIEQIEQLLVQKNYRQIKSVINELLPQDTALILEELPDKEILPIFRLLSKENAADTFVEMSPTSQEMLLGAFSDSEIKEMLDEMFVDDTVDIIEEMPATVVRRIINQTDQETRNWINTILNYPKNSAGAVMTVEYVSLKKNWTVEQCFAYIRKIAVDKETIYNCYVTDEKRKLLGIVTVKDLLLNDYKTTVESIMETNVVYVETLDDEEYVASQMSKYDLSAMPVVDKESRVVGIITIDDVLDIVQQEATEDISMMAAVTPSDTPYLQQSIWQIWKNRLPWLLILLISSTFTSVIINNYEATLSALLFACVPMIMGTGGNAGSQASVTVTRSMAIDEVSPKNIWEVLWKEIRVSVFLGLALAVACFCKIMFIDNLLLGSMEYTWDICLSVSIALFLTIVLAKVVGCLMPIIAKLCKLDPAVVASPFITTIIDVLSLIIYCQIATAILPAI